MAASLAPFMALCSRVTTSCTVFFLLLLCVWYELPSYCSCAFMGQLLPAPDARRTDVCVCAVWKAVVLRLAKCASFP
jgi:hypothetical protein